MLTIKNLTNSPYPVVLADGSKEMLPARGTLENVDVHPQHVSLYRAIGYFQITESGGEPAPLKKAKKPKASPEPVDPALAKLRKDYKELTGKKPFGGWKADRLQAEIDKALAS